MISVLLMMRDYLPSFYRECWGWEMEGRTEHRRSLQNSQYFGIHCQIQEMGISL